MKPLAIDLFCGLGGWAEGFLTEGYDVIGFDIERHDYGTGSYPGQLVLQDVLTLDGAQFKNAAVIVASPPCQFFSYTAMPWTRARELANKVRRSPKRLERELALFKACFRIQREAVFARTREHLLFDSDRARAIRESWIPMVVENVCGAQKWICRAKSRYRSYYLWGDVPALMPRTQGTQAVKVASEIGRRTDPGKGARFTSRDCGAEGVKFGGTWWNDATNNLIRKASSKSSARKAASAEIAKIPLNLARHVAKVYKPS